MDFWYSAFNFVLAVIIGELTRPKQKYDKPKVAGLDEFNFPTATENRPVPVVFGTSQVKSPNTLARGDLQATRRYRPCRQNLQHGHFRAKACRICRQSLFAVSVRQPGHVLDCCPGDCCGRCRYCPQ